MGDEKFLKLNSSEAHAYLALCSHGERSRLANLYKERVGIEPAPGPLSGPASQLDENGWKKGLKPALGIVSIGVVAALIILNLPAKEQPRGQSGSSLSALQHECDRELRNQDLRNAERSRAQAALTDAEAALAAKDPELQAYYQHALEQEMGLLPGEGQGWRQVYAGRKADAERWVREAGAMEIAPPGACKDPRL